MKNSGVSSVCDPSCAPSSVHEPRFDSFLCGAGDASKYGRSCRTCYTDPEKGLKADRLIIEAALEKDGHGGEDSQRKHVIMCGTLRPPSDAGCTRKCSMSVDTVRAVRISFSCCAVLE